MNGVLAAAGTVPVGEAVTFWVLAPLALGGAMGMVLARNAIHSALFLVLTMGCLAAFYFVQQGPFLGAVQIIVYTGAIMILFLFVLMLVGRDASDSIVETLRGQRVAATLLGIGFAGLAATGVGRALGDVTPAGLTGDNAPTNNVNAVAEKLFTDYLFAFELTSALLIVAAVGAMVLAHVEREDGGRRTQREWVRERFRTTRPQPLPGPGVFATGDSVATPALLPDGSVSGDSISRLVEAHVPDEPGLGVRPALDPEHPGAGRLVTAAPTAGHGPDVPGAAPGGAAEVTGPARASQPTNRREER